MTGTIAFGPFGRNNSSQTAFRLVLYRQFVELETKTPGRCDGRAILLKRTNYRTRLSDRSFAPEC
jgi:hypothetical protein